MKKTQMLMLMSVPFFLFNGINTDVNANSNLMNIQSKQPVVVSIFGDTNKKDNQSTPLQNKPGDSETKKIEESKAPSDSNETTKKSDSISSPDNTSGTQEQKDQTGKTPVTQTPAESKPFYENKLFYLGFVGVVIIAAILGALTYRSILRRREARRLRKSLMITEGDSQAVKRRDYGQSENAKMRFRVGNLHNIGRREEQQDSFCLSDIYDREAIAKKGLLAVVADGMGGLEGGAAISKLVCNTFLRSYANCEEISKPKDFLYDTAATAENKVEEYMNQKNVDGGSTLVTVFIKNGAMDFLSVGDSHIYLLRNEKLKQLNREHNFGEILKEKAARGEVDKNEPYVNPQRHALTAYIGMGSFDIVDRNSTPINLIPGDKILLCSDGVYNALKPEAILTALSDDAVSAAKQMEQEIVKKNFSQQDNFTAIILEYTIDERK